MKTLTLKSWILAAGLTFTALSASATVAYTTGDTNPAANAETYKYGNVGILGSSFSDFLRIDLLGKRKITASLSGSNVDGEINVTDFDLYASNKTTKLVDGFTFNTVAGLTFAGLPRSNKNSGTYFLFIKGTSTGTGGAYSGTITTSPVPEPETYGMMLAGLGLMGFVARRRKNS